MLNRLREPYTKKMLEENYQFDKLDLKQANSEFMLRTEIEELIGFACEWLLQVELCYDLLDRSRLYFDFKDLEEDYETVKDRLTAKNKFTLSGFSAGIIRKTLVFLLKRASQLLDIYGKSQIQSLFPSMLLLVYSMVGSTAIPWALKLPRMNIAVIVSLFCKPGGSPFGSDDAKQRGTKHHQSRDKRPDEKTREGHVRNGAEPGAVQRAACERHKGLPHLPRVR